MQDRSDWDRGSNKYTFEALVEATSPLEELVEMWHAIEDTLERVEVSELEGAFAVMATEAGLVINAVVGG